MPHAAFSGGVPRDKAAWRIITRPAHHAPRSRSILLCQRHRRCAERPEILLPLPLLQHKPRCSVPAPGEPGGAGTAWLPECRKASPRPSSGALLGGHITLGSCPHLPVSLEKAFDSFSLVCDPPRLQSCKTWERFAWDRSWPPYPRGTSYTGAHGRIPRAGSAGMCQVLSASRKHNQTSASARQIIPVLQRKRVCFKGSDLITRHCCPSP